jgi:hypothetical protein
MNKPGCWGSYWKTLTHTWLAVIHFVSVQQQWLNNDDGLISDSEYFRQVMEWVTKLHTELKVLVKY